MPAPVAALRSRIGRRAPVHRAVADRPSADPARHRLLELHHRLRPLSRGRGVFSRTGLPPRVHPRTLLHGPAPERPHDSDRRLHAGVGVSAGGGAGATPPLPPPPPGERGVVGGWAPLLPPPA